MLLFYLFGYFDVYKMRSNMSPVLLLIAALFSCFDYSTQQVITQRLTDSNFESGGTGFLVAKVSLSVTDDGEWRKDGSIIDKIAGKRLLLSNTNDGSRQLVIYNIETSDAGLYTYTLQGESTSARITVTSAFAVLTPLQDITVQAGNLIDLSVQLSQAVAAGTWFKNSVPVTSGGRIQITEEGQFHRLRITNAQASDEAQYIYRLSNGFVTSSYVTVTTTGVTPVDGGWSDWSQWYENNDCSATCGPASGTRTRIRQCDNPTPANGGQTCSGSQSETTTYLCTLANCPGASTQVFVTQISSQTRAAGDQIVFTVTLTEAGLTGAWSKDGTQLFNTNRISMLNQGVNRILTVTGLVPSDEGQYSYVVNGQTTTAYLTISGQTPINGGWSQWTQWGATVCQATCGSNLPGTKTRSRQCNNPAPQFNGQNCVGVGEDTSADTCNKAMCPIDGMWSNWGSWSAPVCPVTCGVSVMGSRTRTRTCNSPAPQNGGRECVGGADEAESAQCNSLSACPGLITQGLQNNAPGQGEQVVLQITLAQSGLSGTWFRNGAPLANSAKYQIVDGGTTQRLVINDFQAADAGTYTFTVEGQSTSAVISLGQAAVNGNWGQWAQFNYDICSVSCGGGTQTGFRQRQCNNPAPSGGGSDCIGAGTESGNRQCNLNNCPINGGFSLWSTWRRVETCTETCGTEALSRLERSRNCTNPAPAFGGLACSGDTTESQMGSCNLPACPGESNYGPWGDWVDTPCSITCGSSQTTTSVRSRTCLAANGQCGGSAQQERRVSCGNQDCPVNGRYGEWSTWEEPPCHVTCGNNINKTVQRKRECDNPQPSNGGSTCPGPSAETQTRRCSIPGCPVHGGASTWTTWANHTCSASCGSHATRSVYRSRNCTNPTPSDGGRFCTNHLFESLVRGCGYGECEDDFMNRFALNRDGWIIGAIGAAVAVGVLLIILIIICCCWHCRKEQRPVISDQISACEMDVIPPNKEDYVTRGTKYHDQMERTPDIVR